MINCVIGPTEKVMTDRFDRAGTLDRAGTIFRAILHEIQAERITFMAGTIAYNAFLSLLPLLFLLLAIVSAVGGSELEANMIGVTQALVTPGAAEIFVDELRHASASASLIGLAALVWGMLRIFRSLDMAFSDIYETQARNTLPNQLKDGVVVFGSIAAVIMGAVVLESFFSLSGGSGVVWLLQRLFLVCVVAFALVPMYYLFPDESGMSVLEVIPGVLFTATALVTLQSIFGLYVAFSDPAAENQLLASIVVLLTWLYFCGLVILLGAAINAVLSNRSEDVNIEPLIGGVPKEKVSEMDFDEAYVPEAALRRLQHCLNDSTRLKISLDSDADDIELPPPDIVTVDTDTSPLPVINDTAKLELQWAQASLRRNEK